MLKLLAFTLSLLCALPALSTNKLGRLGIGMSNHLENGLDAISLKIQKNRTTALGGHFAVKTSPEASLYGLGGKYYQLIYEEPQLNFYGAMEASIFTYLDTNDETKQGYQFHALFGSELHLQGIESIGFSFEFGMGMTKASDDAEFKTIGNNIIKSAVHFYL